MPRSAPGSSLIAAPARAARRSRGFTLIEVMMVLALIAIATGIVSLSMRDGTATRLEREAARLAALLETARAEARAAALPVRWMLTPESGEHAFRFVGLPASRHLPMQWLNPEVVAQVSSVDGTLSLGPEALIGAQRVRLRIDQHSLEIGTDGLRPFAVLGADGQPAPP